MARPVRARFTVRHALAGRNRRDPDRAAAAGPAAVGFRTIVLDEFHERSIHADLGHRAGEAGVACPRRPPGRDHVGDTGRRRAARLPRWLPGVRDPRRPASRWTSSTAPAPAVGDAVTEAARPERRAGALLPARRGGVPGVPPSDPGGARRPTVDVVELHGSLTADEQDRALAPRPARRRMIVATNIAETSLTVPGVSGGHRHRAAQGRALRSPTAASTASSSSGSRATPPISAPGAPAASARASCRRLWDAADRLRPHREPDIHRGSICPARCSTCSPGAAIRDTLDWFERPAAAALVAANALLRRWARSTTAGSPSSAANGADAGSSAARADPDRGRRRARRPRSRARSCRSVRCCRAIRPRPPAICSPAWKARAAGAHRPECA